MIFLSRRFLLTFLSLVTVCTDAKNVVWPNGEEPVWQGPFLEGIAYDPFTAHVDSVHYTACLVEKKGALFPSGLNMSPHSIQEPDSEGGEVYQIMTFHNLDGMIKTSAGNVPMGEFCSGFVSKNQAKLFGNSLPDVKYIQESRCFGPNIPGHENATHRMEFSNENKNLLSFLQGEEIYSQKEKKTPWDFDAQVEKNVFLSSFQTHVPRNEYGYFLRVFSEKAIAQIRAVPVVVGINQKLYRQLFGIDLSSSDLQQCWSFQYWENIDGAGDEAVKIDATFDFNEDYATFYRRLNNKSEEFMHKAYELEEYKDAYNLEDKIVELMENLVDPPAVILPNSAEVFRWVTTVFDFLYPFFSYAQKKTYGHYPVPRVMKDRKMSILTHVFVGCIVIYTGVYYHLENEIIGISLRTDEEDKNRHIGYYIMGVAAIVHSISVFLLLPKISGTKVITVPLYLGTSLINLGYGIVIMKSPTLAVALKLWGTMNIFIYVRVFVLFLTVGLPNYTATYTYSIIAAAVVCLTFSFLDSKVILVVFLPILYGIFQDKLNFHFGIEDNIDLSDPGETSVHSEMMLVYPFKLFKSCLLRVKEVQHNSDPEVQKEHTLDSIPQENLGIA